MMEFNVAAVIRTSLGYDNKKREREREGGKPIRNAESMVRM